MTDCTHDISDIPALVARAKDMQDEWGHTKKGQCRTCDLIRDLAAALETALKNGGEVVRSDGSRCTLRQWAVEQKQRADRAEIALDNERERAERAEAALQAETTMVDLVAAERDAALALLKEARGRLLAYTDPYVRGLIKRIDALLAKEDKA